jgi:hypothetical protein
MIAGADGQAVPLEAVFRTLASVVERELRTGSAGGDAGARAAPAIGSVSPTAVSGLTIELSAGNDIPAHRAVMIHDGGYVVLGRAGPHQRLGVAFEGAGRGTSVTVVTSGVEDVEAAGPIARGAYAEVVDGGRIAQAEPKPGYETAALGLALRGASGAGELVPVLISPAGLLG